MVSIAVYYSMCVLKGMTCVYHKVVDSCSYCSIVLYIHACCVYILLITVYAYMYVCNIYIRVSVIVKKVILLI